MKTPTPPRLGAPGGALLGNLAPKGTRGDGRFARLLALDDTGPATKLADQAGPPRPKERSDPERPRHDEPRDLVSAADEGSTPRHAEPLRAQPEQPPSTPDGPQAAESPPRQDFATLAERMLRSLHVGQLPNGVKTLSLQVESGGKARIDVDLRLEAGKLRAQLGVADASAYRALDGKLAALQGALSARGIAAHPVRIDLRRGRDAEQARGSRRREGKGARRRGGRETVI